MFVFVLACYCHVCTFRWICSCGVFFFQAEDGIRDLVRSRGLGDVYKRQPYRRASPWLALAWPTMRCALAWTPHKDAPATPWSCLLYTSDAADERSSVDLGGRRIIKKKNNKESSKREMQNKENG